ncbi:MAG: hypothetical protein QG608_2211 [Actinomycetota bacterium]|nr:hypothetical protein [Actinomycetota bacterium]
MSGSRKYLLAAAVAAAVIVAPTVAQAAAHPTNDPVAAAAARMSCSPAAPVRTVRPGEVVMAAGGVKVWLSEEGKFWQTKGDPEANFRSVVDGNIDRSEPGVSLQSSEAEVGVEGLFFSGVYYGPGMGKAVKVVLEGSDGKICEGSLLTLPGDPGWGVWYVDSPVSHWDGAHRRVARVSVLAAQGKVLASVSIPPIGGGAAEKVS